MSAPSGNSGFCFPSTLNVSTSSRETLRLSGKQTRYFPREQTLSVYYYIISITVFPSVLSVTKNFAVACVEKDKGKQRVCARQQPFSRFQAA